MLTTWSYRWASEIFHGFGQQVTGLEAAQVRKAEAPQPPLSLELRSAVAVERAPVGKSKSERFALADGKITIGQKSRPIARQALRALLELSKRYFAEGKSCEKVLNLLMPA